MPSFFIYRGAVSWDMCKAFTAEDALAIARQRYPESGDAVWVRPA